VGDAIEFSLRLVGEGQHLLDGVPVLALEAADEFQPLFDLLQSLGIELHLIPVVSDPPRQFAQDLERRLGLCLRVGQRIIQTRQVRQARRSVREEIQRRALLLLSIGEQREHLIRQRRALFGVRQKRALALELFLLAGRQACRPDLLALEGQQIHAPGLITCPLGKPAEFPAHLANALRQRGKRLALGPQSSVAIQEVDVPPHLHERQVLPLPVDVHQVARDLPQGRQRHGAPVHPADAAAFRADLAPHDQLRAILRQTVFLQRGAECSGQVPAQREHPLDHRPIAARADQVAGSPPAEQQVHGIDDDRFASARFAGQHIQAAAELQPQ